jgi:sugar phosphate permease
MCASFSRVNAPLDSTPGRRDPRTWSAWTVTWLSYATYYFGRKNLSVTKATIGQALGEHVLYGVETAYLAAYALGQYGSGWLGDRVGARKLVGYGMVVAALASFAFGLCRTGSLFLLVSLVNGLAQSTGWSGNAKAMQEWTTPGNRGRVMGVWATCYQIGGIAATAFATWLLTHFGWQSAYYGPAILIAVSGITVLMWLLPGPAMAQPGSDSRSERRLLARSPILWCYSASYFFIKLIRYALIFWLPYYLQIELHYPRGQAGYWSTSFEIGGVAGVMGLGWLSDRMAHVSRSLMSAGSLVGLACALFFYTRVAGSSHAINFAVMALVGLLLFGPDALLSGAAAQDLGGRNAAALALGMINGFGSIGAVLQEVTTRAVSRTWGWNAVFYFLLALALAAALALAPTFRCGSRGDARTLRR